MVLTPDQVKFGERIEELLRVLYDVRREGRLFNLSIWGSTNMGDVVDRDLDVPEDSCGTVACAIGWVGLDPWFRRRGFSSNQVPGSRLYEPIYRHSGDEDHGWNAVCVFFNLTLEAARRLFGLSTDHEDNTLDIVIERVQHFYSDIYGKEYSPPMDKGLTI